MRNSIVIGMQWGDEGKGKCVDVLSSKVDAVIRYQGGANAGHTVIIGKKKVILHLLPTGILQNKISIIGNGVVVDIKDLVNEINQIKKQGFSAKKLIISSRAHILLPTHKIIDSAKEDKRKNKLGTTKSGIGPAYIDKYGRKGIRASDMLRKKHFEEKILYFITQFNKYEATYYSVKKINKVKFVKDMMIIRNKLYKYVKDIDIVAKDLIDKKKTILFEGAQGILLDIDFGTYPFVTSSHTIAPYAFCGSGIPVLSDYQVIGILKAYTTRVGKGPFPTRLTDKEDAILRKKGNEFGAKTGRARNCGWLDLFATKYAAFLNGTNKLIMTKIDILANMETVRVCTGYKLNGKLLKSFPADTDLLDKIKPVYKTMKGWSKKDIDNLKKGIFAKSIKDYIELTEKFTGAKIIMLSTGPTRKDIVFIEKI